jgi:putative solute:sodium symporter small subunit
MSDEAGQDAGDAAGGRYWPLRAGLLLVWAAASFGVCYFARDLFVLLGQPLGYWMASQGVLVVFILIVVVYATVVNRRERLRLAAEAPAGADAAQARG